MLRPLKMGSPVRPVLEDQMSKVGHELKVKELKTVFSQEQIAKRVQ